MKPKLDQVDFSGRLLTMLGRLLPTEVRKRIFEPAFYDLLHDHFSGDQESRSRSSLVLGASKLAIGSIGYGLVHVVLRWRAIKRFFVGLTVFASLVVIVSVFLLRDWIGQIVRY